MSDFERSRDLWTRKLALWSLSFELRNTIVLLVDGLLRGVNGGALRSEIPTSRMRRAMERLPELQSSLDRLLPSWVAKLQRSSKDPKRLPKKLADLLRDEDERVDAELAHLKDPLEKAKGLLLAAAESGEFDPDQIYDAMVAVAQHTPQTAVDAVVSMWKAAARRHREQSKASPFTTGPIFWTSGDFKDSIDGMSRYRFCEVFDIGDFDDAMSGVEGLFASAVMSGYADDFAFAFGDREIGPVTFDMWLASRSPKLTSRIRPFLEIALPRILANQTEEGWWPDVHRTEPAGKSPEGPHRVRPVPDQYFTGLAAVAILRLSRQDWQFERGRLAVKWLVQQQSEAGGWGRLRGDGKAVDVVDEAMTTVLVLDAIRLSGLSRLRGCVRRGESWLLSAQRMDGTWEDEHTGMPWPFTTVLVVEYFDHAGYSPALLANYLAVARSFISRSREFALEDSDDARRLAVVTSFQGIEAFLYGCLSAPAANIRFLEKGQSIGVRDALGKVQEHLQKTKVLARGQSVDYRSSLDRLVYLRGEVVHKAAAVSRKDCNEVTGDAARFADLYCQKLFGHMLL